MSYIKEYFRVFSKCLLALGIVNLALMSMEGNPTALYFVYLSVLAGIGGPISYAVNLENK